MIINYEQVSMSQSGRRLPSWMNNEQSHSLANEKKIKKEKGTKKEKKPKRQKTIKEEEDDHEDDRQQCSYSQLKRAMSLQKENMENRLVPTTKTPPLHKSTSPPKLVPEDPPKRSLSAPSALSFITPSSKPSLPIIPTYNNLNPSPPKRLSPPSSTSPPLKKASPSISPSSTPSSSYPSSPATSPPKTNSTNLLPSPPKFPALQTTVTKLKQDEGTSSPVTADSPLRSPQLSPDITQHSSLSDKEETSPLSKAIVNTTPSVHIENNQKFVSDIHYLNNTKYTQDEYDDNDSNYSSGSDSENEEEKELDKQFEKEFETHEKGASDDGYDPFLQLSASLSPLPSPQFSSGDEKELEEQKPASKPSKKISYFVCERPCSERVENANQKLTDALEHIQKVHAYKGEQWYGHFV